MADYRLHAPTSIAPRFDGFHQVILSSLPSIRAVIRPQFLYSSVLGQFTTNKRTVLRKEITVTYVCGRALEHILPDTIFDTLFPFSFFDELSAASRCVKDLRATEERLNDSTLSSGRNSESDLFLVRTGASHSVTPGPKGSHKAFEFKA